MISRRSVLGFITTASAASLVTWFAVGEDPPVSVDVDVNDDALLDSNVSTDGNTKSMDTPTTDAGTDNSDGELLIRLSGNAKKQRARRTNILTTHARGTDEVVLIGVMMWRRQPMTMHSKLLALTSSRTRLMEATPKIGITLMVSLRIMGRIFIRRGGWSHLKRQKKSTVLTR